MNAATPWCASIFWGVCSEMHENTQKLWRTGGQGRLVVGTTRSYVSLHPTTLAIIFVQNEFHRTTTTWLPCSVYNHLQSVKQPEIFSVFVNTIWGEVNFRVLGDGNESTQDYDYGLVKVNHLFLPLFYSPPPKNKSTLAGVNGWLNGYVWCRRNQIPRSTIGSPSFHQALERHRLFLVAIKTLLPGIAKRLPCYHFIWHKQTFLISNKPKQDIFAR